MRYEQMAITLSRWDRHHLDQVQDVTPDTKTTTYSMGVNDLVINASTTAAAWTLTLPPVGQATGRTYTVNLTAGAAAGAAPNALTIKHKNDSKNWNGNVVLRRPGQVAKFTSDGERWVKDVPQGAGAIVSKYVHEMFEMPFVTAAKATGGAPGTTLENVLLCASGNYFSYIAIVAQTLTGPAWADPGMNIAMDQTDGDGVEFSTGVGAGNPRQFVIGTDPAFFCRVRFSIADVSGLGEMAVGFREREAYAAAIDNYTDMAAINVQAGTINLETILNNAATVTTDTTQDWADTETHTLAVFVSAAGVVTYQIDDAAPTATAAYTFANTLSVIPFIHMLQASDLGGAVVILEWEFGHQN